MLTKPIPPWITLGGMTLAGSAGCINAVGFLGGYHQAISHMTGTVTNFGVELAQGDGRMAWHAGGTLGFFFMGCVLSGLIIRQSALEIGRSYGVALACEFGLLIGACYFFRHGEAAGSFLAAMACGLQNAMATSCSSAVIRTTHFTGIVTDLGIALGRVARRESVDGRRLRLYLVLLLGFFAGGVFGTVSFVRIGYDTLLIPAAISGLTAIGYTLYKRHWFRLPFPHR